MEAVGFTGQVDARTLSRIIANTNPGVGWVLGPGDMKVTAQAARRSIRIAPGEMQSGVIWARETNARGIDLPVPAIAQQFMVVVEFNAVTGTADYVLLPGVPETRPGYEEFSAAWGPIPSSWRGNLTHVGTDTWHVPLAWVEVRRRDNALQIYDMRNLRGGLPAPFAFNRGIMRYDRPGNGYDAWAKQPARGFIATNRLSSEAFDLPAGLYRLHIEFSLGATVECIGTVRVSSIGASNTGEDNWSRDIRVDLGAHQIVSWNREIVHGGGVLQVEVTATVARADGGAVAGSIQNGTGFLEVAYVRALGE